jgi:hypothetical protein
MSDTRDPSRAFPPREAAIVAVELCRFRVSACGCLDRPAICLLTGEPGSVTFDRDCLPCRAKAEDARPAGGPWRPRGAIDGPGVPSPGPPAGDAP